MITPYDWQEGMQNRTAYVQGRLSAGTPVLMLSLPEGIVGYAVRRQARKIYEIYDRLMFGAIGQQSDVESMRVGSIDYCHQEGYNRSEDDVTIARVINALSTPMKRAFSDFNSTPFVVQGLFAELGDSMEEDSFYILDFDGDYSIHRLHGYLVGNPEVAASVHEKITTLDRGKLKPEAAKVALRDIWVAAMDPEGNQSPEAILKNLTEEFVLMRRKSDAENRFVTL